MNGRPSYSIVSRKRVTRGLCGAQDRRVPGGIGKPRNSSATPIALRPARWTAERAERALAAGDRQRLVQHGAGRPAPSVHSARSRRCARRHARTMHRAWARRRAPDAAPARGRGELEPRFGLVDLGRVGDAVRGLEHRGKGGEIRQHRAHQPRAEPRQLHRQLARILGTHKRAADVAHRPGIQSALHLHDRDARFRISREDRALESRRAAPARQQRGVDVQAAMTRASEHRLGQQQSIGRDHCGIEPKRRERRLLVRAAQRGGAAYGQAKQPRAQLDRRRAIGLAAPRRPRRLRVDAGDLVPGRPPARRALAPRNRACRGRQGAWTYPKRLAAGRASPYLAGDGFARDRRADAGARPPAGSGARARRGARCCTSSRSAEAALDPLRRALEAVSERLATCATCGNVDTTDPCAVCADPRRDQRLLCVVEEVADLWALDRTRLFPGRFHVLGGRLAALEGIRPEDLTIDQLVRRIATRRNRRGGAGDERHAGGADHRPLSRRAAGALSPCASPSSRTACRWAASSTISTRARWRRRSAARGGRWRERA